MKEIDARGLSCPAPVLMTKAAIENDTAPRLRVLVDNEAARQNVCRFLASRGYSISHERTEEAFQITGESDSTALPEDSIKKEEVSTDRKRIMVMIATDRLGFGDEVLGKKLMANFIRTLKEMGSDLWRLVFVNNGVKLAVTGSEILEDLKELQARGTGILVCGTCLTHFNLMDRKEVGDTTNMLDIVTAMQLADKVINL